MFREAAGNISAAIAVNNITLLTTSEVLRNSSLTEIVQLEPQWVPPPPTTPVWEILVILGVSCGFGGLLVFWIAKLVYFRYFYKPKPVSVREQVERDSKAFLQRAGQTGNLAWL